MAEACEIAAETPSPTSKRPLDNEECIADIHRCEPQATPTPLTKRRCTGPRDRAALVEATALEAAAEAETLLAQAEAAEHTAAEAMQRAHELAKEAATLRASAEQAKEKADEAKRATERAALESSAEGRAFLRAIAKEQEKADKKLALETARAQKQQERDEANASRAAIKSMGDAIKESLRMTKVQEGDETVTGSVSFSNVLFSTFRAVFVRGRCDYTPASFCDTDATISVATEDAATIFGAAKVSSGTTPSFTITHMRATYIPDEKHLMIAYAGIPCSISSGACPPQ